MEPNRGSSNPRVLAIAKRVDQLARESFDRTWALRRISREIGNLRLSADKAPSGLIDKILLPSTQVNNNTICVICRRLMSTPSTIAECGHTFCQNCLMEWFDHIKLEHEADHPNQRDANQEYILYFHQVSRNLAISTSCIPTFRELLSYYFPDPPIYSCPTCRAHVLSPPVVVFALKDLIHTVAQASFESGDDSFPQAEYRRQTESQGSADAWDKFFAKRPTSVQVAE